MDIHVRALQIPIKYSPLRRKTTDTIWVTVKDGNFVGLGEGIPQPDLTSETLEKGIAWIQKIAPFIRKEISRFLDLKDWAEHHQKEINQYPAAWCALEMAIIDLLARKKDIQAEDIVNVRPSRSRFEYTAVIQGTSIPSFTENLSQYLQLGFWDFKFDLSGDPSLDQSKINLFQKMTRDRLKVLKPIRLLHSLRSKTSPFRFRLRLNAQGLWEKDVEKAFCYLQSLETPLHGVEEPFSPSSFREVSELSTRLGMPIILTERIQTKKDLKKFDSLSGKFIANVQISRLGGILRSLRLIEELRKRRWPIIIGAHPGETSLLSRAALILAQASEDLLFAQEGAGGRLLLEHEQVKPEVRFGKGGILRFKSKDSGFGLHYFPN